MCEQPLGQTTMGLIYGERCMASCHDVLTGPSTVLSTVRTIRIVCCDLLVPTVTVCMLHFEHQPFEEPNQGSLATCVNTCCCLQSILRV